MFNIVSECWITKCSVLGQFASLSGLIYLDLGNIAYFIVVY